VLSVNNADGSHQDDNMAPVWYPPYYYAAAAAAAANMPPLYYPTSQWGYGYAGWPQLSAVAVTNEKNGDKNMSTTSCEVSDGSHKTLEHTRGALGSIDDIDDSDDDNMPSSSHKPSDVQPPLSALQTEYSSSSTASSSNSSPRNSPMLSTLPTQSQHSSADFDKRLKNFTAVKALMIRNIRAAPLNLSSVSSDEGKRCHLQGYCHSYRLFCMHATIGVLYTGLILT